jgi:hypothetical protein
MIRLLARPLPSLSQSSFVSPAELLTGVGEGGAGGVAKSYAREKAWPYINSCFITSLHTLIKEVLRREIQGLKVYQVYRSYVFSMTGTYF